MSRSALVGLLTLATLLRFALGASSAPTLLVAFSANNGNVTYFSYTKLVQTITSSGADFFLNPAALDSIITSQYTTIFLMFTGLSRDFTSAEFQAIAQTVKRGNRLILMGGDPTNQATNFLQLYSMFFSSVSGFANWQHDSFTCTDSVTLGEGLPASYTFASGTAAYYAVQISDSDNEIACVTQSSNLQMFSATTFGQGSVIFISLVFEDDCFVSNDVPYITQLTKNALLYGYTGCASSTSCATCLSSSRCQYCRDTNTCQVLGGQCSNYWTQPSFCPMQPCQTINTCTTCTSGSQNGNCFFCPSNPSASNGTCLPEGSTCSTGKIADPQYCNDN